MGGDTGREPAPDVGVAGNSSCGDDILRPLTAIVLPRIKRPGAAAAFLPAIRPCMPLAPDACCDCSEPIAQYLQISIIERGDIFTICSRSVYIFYEPVK